MLMQVDEQSKILNWFKEFALEKKEWLQREKKAEFFDKKVEKTNGKGLQNMQK